MSQESQHDNEEREDIVNKPIVVVPNVESNKPNPKTILDTSESEHYLKHLDMMKTVTEGLTAGLSNAERKEREMRYNQVRLEPTKINQFKKFLSKSVIEKKKKPEIISSIFHDNKIYTPSQGFTLTEMAIAWLDHYQKRDKTTLDAMKKRIKSWIVEANKTQDARIYGTQIRKGLVRYHIAKRDRDLNSQIGVLDEFKENIAGAEDKRKALAELVKKEQKPEIVIDTQGNPVPTEEVKPEEEQEEGGETEQ